MVYTPGWFVALLGVFLMFPSAGVAVEVDGLFNAEVPVFDRGVEQRRAGIKSALEKVLVKVSGNQHVIFVPGIIPPENEIERLVEQFGYSEIEYDETELVSDENVDLQLNDDTEFLQAESDEAQEDPLSEQAEEPKPTLNLWVGFDSNAVLKRLQQANLPVWDRTRPLTLVWVAVQDGGERYLLEPELHLDIKDVMDAQAAERGMPIAFPLMDLEDRTLLTPTDVWGDFGDAIMLASQRYGADAVLVVRLSNEGDAFWRARWTLYHGDESNHWESTGENQEQSLTQGLHSSADTLASRYAQVLLANLEPPLTMTLHGINQFDHYAKAINYLESLTQIASLDVFRVTQNKLELNLSIRGNRDGLEKVIRLGGVLAKMEAEVAPMPVMDVDPFAAAGVPEDELLRNKPHEEGLVYRLLP